MATENQSAFYERMRLMHPTMALEYPATLPASKRDASGIISNFMSEIERKYGFRPGSRRAQIADMLDSVGGNVESARIRLQSRLTDDRFDFAFTRNPSRDEKLRGITSRQPMPLSAQLDALERTISNVAEGKAWSSRPSGNSPVAAPAAPVAAPVPVPVVPEPVAAPVPAPAPVPAGRMTAAEFLAKLREIRHELAENASGDPTMALDEIGMRPMEYGAHMYKAGIPFEGALYALTMHWSEMSRSRFGIENYAQEEFGERKSGKHAKLAYCLALAKAGVPIMLVGPKGTGKSHLAKDIADEMGLTYGQCPMTAGATPSWLAGKYTIGSDDMPSVPEPTGETMDDFLALLRVIAERTNSSSFVSTELLHAIEHGGVFVFEEMDAADPNMLLLVNNLLANGEFHNPVNGRTIVKHENFVPIACTNTFGLGADRRYKGREGLDAASLDRWQMGRVKLEIDETLESEIFWSIIND